MLAVDVAVAYAPATQLKHRTFDGPGSDRGHTEADISEQNPGDLEKLMTFDPTLLRRAATLTAGLYLPLGCSGCTDEAKGLYETCIALEAHGDLTGAVVACQSATSLDSNSPSGRAAAEKLTVLTAKIAENKKAEAERRAREEKEAQEAQTEAITEFSRKHYRDHQERWSPYDWQFAGVEVISSEPTQKHGAAREVKIKISAKAVGKLVKSNVYGYPTSTFFLYFDASGHLVHSDVVSRSK